MSSFKKSAFYVFLSTHRQTLSLAILLLAALFILVGWSSFATTNQELQANTSLIYPLKEISTLEGRAQMVHWNELSPEYKIQLPRIKSANYSAYANNEEYLNIYTTLRGDTYLGQGREQDVGDHEGVDIATARGTPVYAIAHGVVTFAGTQAWYWNVVKLMFSYRGETLHAIFAHLDDIYVSSWQRVSQGQQIGTVGNTWNTFGALGWYHLNFEINKDAAGRPIYTLYNCPALETHSREEVVNKWLCNEYRIANSYDPILLIEQARDRSQDNTTQQDQLDKPVKQPSSNPPREETKQEPETAPSQPSPQQTKKFLDIKTIPRYKLSAAASQFIKERDIQIVTENTSRLKTGEKGELVMYITKIGDAHRNFEGVLPTSISILSPNGKLLLDTYTIWYVKNWKIPITYHAKERGSSTISINIDGQNLAVMPLTVVE